MAADAERRRFNVGAIKIEPELRDVAHAVLTSDDDRGFVNIIGAADTNGTETEDHTLPVGAAVTYSVELTDDEAEAFRAASNCRYVELDDVVYPHAAPPVSIPSANTLAFMGADFPDAGEFWHGRDVPVAVLDGGTSAAVRAYMGWTLLARQNFSTGVPDADGVVGTHGCLVAPNAVPVGGILIDGLIVNDQGLGSISATATAMRWAADLGARVINLSYGAVTSASQTYVDAIVYVQARGIQFVASAGNDNLNQIGYPAAYSTTYANVHSAVAWDTATGQRANFGSSSSASNYDDTASGVTPGNNVISLTPAAVQREWDGTSAAAPHMASLIVKGCTGDRFTPEQVGAALKANTRVLSGVSAEEQGGGAYDFKQALTALGAFSAATRTNRAVNPSCLNNATNWFSSGTGARVTGVTGLPRTTGYQATTQFITPQFAVTAGQTYTTSIYIRNTTAATLTVSFDWYNGATYLSGSGSVTYTVQAGGVQQVVRTAVAPATATAGLMKVATSAGTMTATAHLVEQTGARGTFFDGSSPNSTWSGTAGNSTSTRTWPVASPATRRNLCPNPSVETNVSGHSAVSVRTGTTVTAAGRGTTVAPVRGTYYATTNITGDGTTSTSPSAEVTLPTAAVSAGLPYTFSAHVRYTFGGLTLQWQITWRDSGGATLSTALGTTDPVMIFDFTRHVFTTTAPAGAVTAVPKLLLRPPADSTLRSFRWDAVQYEQASDPSDYFDGATVGGSWDGTANNSTSTYASSALTVSPTGIASGEAFGTPVVGLPAAIIQPEGIPSGEAFGTPVVGANQIISPAGIATAEAVGTPALTIGSPPQTVSPDGIGSAEVFGSPAVAPDQQVQPVGIASGEVFGSPRVAPDQVVRPTGITSGQAFGVPEVFAAPVPINPDLRIDFWALDDDGTLLCPLPHPTGWDLSLIPGESGAVSLEYPVDGRNFDVLDQRVTRRRDLRIKIRHDGSDDTAFGAILHARDGDQVSEGGTVRFLGKFLTWLLAEAPLPYNSGTEKGEWLYPDGTAGSILADVLNTVKADHFLDSASWTFTDTLDSNGTPWTLETSAKFPPGRTVLQVAQQLRKWGMLEFEVVDLAGIGIQVRAYEPSAIGTDHTIANPPVVLRRGRDLTDAPRRMDVSVAATTLLVAGADGVYAEVDNPTVRAERGRKIGQYVSEGNLTTHGSAVAYGTLELSRRVVGADELTHSLTFDQNSKVPIRDLMPLDWVYTDTGDGSVDGSGVGARERIAQITISQPKGSDHYRGGVVLRDLIESRELAVANQLDGLKGGQIVTGVSQPGQPVDDGIPPEAPEGLAAVSAAYYDGATPLATVTASWLEVDDTALSDYELQWHYQAGQGIGSGWQSAGRTRATTLSWSSLVAEVAVDIQVRAHDRFNRVSDWSPTFSLTTGADATAPPTPSTPDASSYLGILTFAWDGLGSAGEGMPLDFDHVEVHASTTSNFTPDRPLDANGRLDEATSTTYIDRLSGAGTMPSTVGSYGETWFGRLVAVDKSGNASAPSAQDSALLAPAGDDDIGAVSIGKLTAGIMSALMTISGIIRTAATGARVELDTTGLRCYSSTGAVLFEFSIPSSALSLIGKLTAGAGVGIGRTITVDPNGDGAQPAVVFYPDATTQRARLRALNDTTPDGSGTAPIMVLEVLNASGTPAGGTINLWNNAAMLFSRVTAGNTPAGGVLYAGNNQAYMGNDNGIVQIDNGGSITITHPAGQTTNFVRPPGTSGAGFSFRLQGGDDEGVRAIYAGGLLRFADNQAGGGYMNLGGPSGGYKTFVVPHPLDDPADPQRWLIHVATESPDPRVTYDGTATIVGGRAEVELPPYFEALCREDGRTVQVTMLLPDEPLVEEIPGPPPPAPVPPFAWPPESPAVVRPEHDLLHPVAASLPRNGRFRIASPAPDGTRVAWTVSAIRRGPDLEVEPLRSEVDVHGDGPYRWIGAGTRD